MMGLPAVEECLFPSCHLPCKGDTDSIILDIAVRSPWPLQGGCRTEKDIFFFFFFPHECEYFSSLKMKGRILEKRNCIRKVTVMPKEAFALMLPTERERFATGKLRRSLECPLKSAFVTAVTVFLLPM